MTGNNKHIDSLIAKYLTGEISPTEKRSLREWIDHAPENRKYFEDLEYVHDKATTSYRYVRVNVEKAWEDLSHKMDEITTDKPVTKPISGIVKSTWLRIAASIIILVGLSFLLYTHFLRSPKILQSEIIASNDSIKKVTLTQNTQIVLNKNTRVTYTATKKSRKIKLSGEAFFNVKHSDRSSLVVEAGGTFIRDIGTSFNVKAIPGENTVEVYVESGKVKFYATKKQGISIIAGETGVYRKDTKQFTKKTKPNLNAIAYKTKIFVFRRARLADVVDQLNAVYPQTITLENPALSDCPITVKFENIDLHSAVEIIAETLGLQLAKTPNGFVLNGERCNSQ